MKEKNVDKLRVSEMITVQIVNHMFSHGVAQGKPEFRLTELKSAMRYWWRACSCFCDIKDMKTEESKLFGSTSNSSPFLLKYVEQDKNENYNPVKKEINEYIRGRAIPTDTEISFILQLRKTNEEMAEPLLQGYKNIVYLVSFLGGLGRYSRKGQGVFYIKNTKLVSTKEEIVKKIKTMIKIVANKERTFQDIKGKFYSGFKCNYKKDGGKILYYPYIEEIIVGDAILVNEFDNRIKSTLAVRNKDERQYNFSGERYACPIYITCYPADESNKVFPIIVVLKNTTLNSKKIKNCKEVYKQFKKVCIEEMMKE